MTSASSLRPVKIQASHTVKHSINDQNSVIALIHTALNGRTVLEARLVSDELLDAALALVISCMFVAVDRMDCLITEHRPTQLVPGALVIESPSSTVRPAVSVAKATLVMTEPEPRVIVEFIARV